MSKAPQRLWIDPDTDILPSEWHKKYHGDVEYIRTDRIEELEAKLVKAVEAFEDMLSEYRSIEESLDDHEGEIVVAALKRSYDAINELNEPDQELLNAIYLLLRIFMTPSDYLKWVNSLKMGS